MNSEAPLNLHKLTRDSKNAGFESAHLAWASHTLAIEQKQGISVSNSFFSIKRQKIYNFYDTPGHPDFISECISAAMISDAAIIVVDCSVRKHFDTKVLLPTKDFAYLAKACGINFVTFALAKTEKKQEMKGRIDEIQQKVMNLAKGIGLKTENIRFVKISVVEDYVERSFVESLDFVSRPVGDEYKPLRILIDDRYKLVHGNLLGQCITGFIISGVASVGVTICVEQAKFAGKVKEIMKSGEKVRKAMAGDWVDITLNSLGGELSDISRGFIACSDTFGILTGQKLRLRGLTNDIQIPVLKKQELILFIGSIKTPVTVLKVLRQVNGKEVKLNPRCLKSKCIGDIEIFCHNEIALEKSKNLQKLGRCLLLSQNKLIFTGMIIDVLN